MSNLPIIALTMGDPAGIGPETVLKSLRDKTLYKICRPLVIADKQALLALAADLGLSLRAITQADQPRFVFGQVDVLDCSAKVKGNYKKRQPSAHSGRVSAWCVQKSVQLALDKKVQAIVHAPISKIAWKMAGIKFPAHTEMIASLCKIKKVEMAIAAGPLRTVMVTRHMPLLQAAQKLKKQRIVDAIIMAASWMQQLQIKNPRIGVCALNPHAGEGGLLGQEEIQIITPAIQSARKLVKAFVSDVLPADSALRDHRKGLWDCLITMYHDQSLIPLKIMFPDQLVNITLGLPFVRLSPGHGTAFDIAGQGKASALAMQESIRVAAAMAGKK